MNSARRDKLRGAVSLLDRAETAIRAVCDQEEDCLDNIPENLQSTERYEKSEAAIDCLNDAMERLDEVKELVQTAISQ